jgi:hypothetical protein
MVAYKATYEVHIDLDNDGDFDGANEDVSGLWQDMEWMLGSDNEEDNIARASNAKITLDNSDKRFSPESSLSAIGTDLRPGNLVRIVVRYPESATLDATQGSGVTRGYEGIRPGEICPYFTGTNSYLNIYSSRLASIMSPARATYIFMWVKVADWMDGVTRNFFRITGTGGSGTNMVQAYSNGSGAVVIDMFCSGTHTQALNLTAFSADDNNEWILMGFSFAQGSGVTVYKSAEQIANTSTAATGTWSATGLSSTATVIGAATTVPAFPMQAYIAHVAIWAETSITYAKRLYMVQERNDYYRFVISLDASTVTVGGEGPLLAYWPMTEIPGGTTAYDHAVRQQMFIGRIDEDGIKPEPGTRDNRRVVIEASGTMIPMMDEPVGVGIQEDKTADEIIAAMILASGVYPPGTYGWALGVGRYSELEETAWLAHDDQQSFSYMDTGATVFNYAGDNWDEETTIHSALKDVMMAEQGFLFEDRDGKIRFQNRHYWMRAMVRGYIRSFANAQSKGSANFKYSYGNIINEAVISYAPRTVADSIDVVARGRSTLSVQAGGEETSVTIRYDTEEGVRTGAKDLVEPEPVTDYVAFQESDGSGFVLTSYVSLVRMTDKGNSVELTFVNNWDATAHITQLQVRGKKITFGKGEARYRDDQSIQDNKLRVTKSYRINMIDDANYAQGLANWIVSEHKDPHVTDKAMRQMLYQMVGMRLRVSESQTGVSTTEYYIIGERHKVGVGRVHRVTYYLRQAPRTFYWILEDDNYSQLDNTTSLAL